MRSERWRACFDGNGGLATASPLLIRTSIGIRAKMGFMDRSARCIPDMSKHFSDTLRTLSKEVLYIVHVQSKEVL